MVPLARESPLAATLRLADLDVRYDAHCKRLLSLRIVLAPILKHCLAEYAPYPVGEISQHYIEGDPQVGLVPVGIDASNPAIRGLRTEDATHTEGTVTYDIRFYALVPKTGELVRLIINAELQNDYHPGYPLLKRGLYYCGRLLSAQHGTEFTDSHYEKLVKVYSIFICMEPPKQRQHTINRYEIVERNLLGQAQEPPANYYLLSVVMIGLGEPEEAERGSLPRLLSVLLSDRLSVGEKQQILEEEFDLPMTEELEEELTEMCDLSRGVWRRGLAEGEAKGIAIGEARGEIKGEARGVTKTMASSIRKLMVNLSLSMEQAMNALEVPQADRAKYAKMLQ